MSNTTIKCPNRRTEEVAYAARLEARQKPTDGVLQNTTEMYGSPQGIAGLAALEHIDTLELPEERERGDDE